MTSVHDSVDTVTAAATAIVAAQARVQPPRVQKRRWAGWWSLYWCFGSYKHNNKRIAISEQLPLTCHLENIRLPFIAPPSSPASYLPSDSALLSLSPPLTAHIFLIGPYAHETNLVSPPVFSTYTTQPSTPPPEPPQITTPSSPEAPFAQLLSSSLLAQRWRNTANKLRYPSSQPSTSGTSSPFDKRTNIELHKFVGYEHLVNCRRGSRVGSGSMTPNGWGSRLGSGALTPNGAELPSQDSYLDHRVSFELTTGDTPTCIVKETIVSSKFWSETMQKAAQGTKGKDLAKEVAHCFRAQTSDNGRDVDGEAKEWHQKHGTVSLGSSKDFNFNNTKKEVATKDLNHHKNWTFFPMLQSGAVYES